MGLDLDYYDGQTPLDEDEKEGLLIDSITTRGELDEFEQYNIEKAIEWTLTKKWSPKEILSDTFVKELHKRMFNEVWSWAGNFRKTNKNIGVDKFEIGVSLKMLLDDSFYWLDNGIYKDDEFAIRLKHRIVQIHCFPNGNGRHSRLIADVIIHQIFGEQVFTWNSESLNNKGPSRSTYLNALKDADKGNIVPLIEFARS